MLAVPSKRMVVAVLEGSAIPALLSWRMMVELALLDLDADGSAALSTSVALAEEPVRWEAVPVVVHGSVADPSRTTIDGLATELEGTSALLIVAVNLVW